ncbi:MAG: pentapeptide repeat-containing protein [Blastocatellia bacterium]
MSTTPQLEENISASFICACDEWMRSACASEGFYKERERKRYCVLHYPGSEKIVAFRIALKRKLDAEDLDFRGLWFPEKAGFEGVQFGPNADFHGASFSAGADFSGAGFGGSADFSGASFNADAHFGGASFSGEAFFRKARFNAHADFNAASFRGRTSFYQARFSRHTDFYRASFSADATFYEASFDADSYFKRVSFSASVDFTRSRINAKVDFSSATFAGYLRFAGDKDHQVFGEHSYLNLQHARVEKPERGSFHTLKLSPHWFVNVDARKFEFVNVDWADNLKGLKQEVETLRPLVSSAPHRLLSIAYRQLAVNAEENHRYGEAADFRYGSMDLRRLERPRDGKGLQVLHWLYWMASGYGERVTRAVVVLAVLWLVFAGLYTRTGFERKTFPDNTEKTIVLQEDEVGRPLPFKRALIYSFAVMSLQKPEPKPLTNAAHSFVIVETILGPIQAALLALAIRRRFMR